MAYSERVEATRTIWVAKCPGCGDSVQHREKCAKICLCIPCQRWIPYVEVSDLGPKSPGPEVHFLVFNLVVTRHVPFVRRHICTSSRIKCCSLGCTNTTPFNQAGVLCK